MAYKLTTPELASFRGLMASIRGETSHRDYEAGFIGQYWRAYDSLAEVQIDTVTGRLKADAEASVVIWLRGASQVNQKVGPFSQFIRSYTATEFQLRTAKASTEEALQEASDLIAGSLAETVLGTNAGRLPTLNQLGEVDAGATIGRLFGDRQDFSAWSGSLLFAILGDDTFFRAHLLDAKNGTYDLFAAIASARAALGQTSQTITFPQFKDALVDVLATVAGNNLGAWGTLERLSSLFSDSLAYMDLNFLSFGGDALTLASADYRLGAFGKDDAIDGDASTDIVNAASGADLIRGSLGSDYIDGGADLDTLDYGGSDWGLKVRAASTGAGALGLVVEKGRQGKDSAINVETLILSGKTDTVTIEPGLRGALGIDAGGQEVGKFDALDLTGWKEAVPLTRRTVDGKVVIEIEGLGTFKGFEAVLGASYPSDNVASGKRVDLFFPGPGADDVIVHAGRDARIIGADRADKLWIEKSILTGNPDDSGSIIRLAGGIDSLTTRSAMNLPLIGGPSTFMFWQHTGHYLSPMNVRFDYIPNPIGHATNAAATAGWSDVRITYKLDESNHALAVDIVRFYDRNQKAEDGKEEAVTLARIIAEDWQPGELGITLTKVPQPEDTSYWQYLNRAVTPIVASTTEKPVSEASSNDPTPTGSALAGNMLPNALQGTGLADALDGGGGNDSLSGGAGDDTLIDLAADGAGGTLDGGTGDDLIQIATGSGGVWVIDGGADKDALELQGRLAAGSSVAGVERLVLTGATTIQPGLLDGLGDVRALPTAGIVHASAGTTDLSRAAMSASFEFGGISHDNTLVFTGSSGDDVLVMPAAGLAKLTAHGDLGDDAISGGAAADVLSGDGGNDALNGMDGDDVLEGGADEDTLAGGAGSDTLRGGDGNDVYVYARGGGHDLVDDTSSLGGTDDKLVLVDLQPTDVSLERQENDLVVVVAPKNVGGQDGGRIMLPSQLDDYHESGIEKIVFANGTIWTRADIRARLQDVRTTPGDDVIEGSTTPDTLEGGRGNDLLKGHAGNDTYIYLRGDGSDVVDESDAFAGTADRLMLNGITPGEVALERQGENAVLVIAPSTGGGADGGRVTILGQHNSSLGWERGVEQVVFADGTAWTPADIRLRTISTHSTAGNDTLEGFATDDTLQAGLGNDIVRGLQGNDTYVYHRGDGDDTFDESLGFAGAADELILNGITPGQVLVQRSGNDALLTISASLGGSDGALLTLKEQFSASSELGIEQLIFGDGTVWSKSDLGSNVATVGSNGADYMYGTTAADTLFGRLGDDNLSGGVGGDTYLYRKGDGSDAINDNSGSTSEIDVLKFMDLNPTDVTASRSGWNLLLSVNGTSATVNVNYQFYSSTADWGVEEIRFANGTVWTTDDIQVRTSGKPVIDGTPGSDNLVGTAGPDAMLGRDGEDILNGGAGADDLYGGSGNDILIMDTTAGTAIDVLDGGAGNDTASFSGYSFAIWVDLDYGGREAWTRDLPDLVLGAWREIADLNKIENVAGTAYADQLWGSAGPNVLAGGLGPDRLDGRGGDDWLIGEGGDDVLTGGNGSDTFTFGPGFGKDVVMDFQAGAGTPDLIGFDQALFANMAAIMANANQVGSDTVISFDAQNSITLKNVVLANLHADDFRFV
jgi:Ca2+-binding RTX toxin-like protein